MLSLIFTVIFLAHYGASQPYECPPAVPMDQYVEIFNAVCYQFILDHQRDRETAEGDCESRGGILGEPKTKAINDFIVDRMTNVYGVYAPLWIGLGDQHVEGQFQWEDGSFTNYTNWAAGSGPGPDPSNPISTSEDCVVLDVSKGGVWVGAECSNELFGLITHENRYVCQYRTRQVTTKR